MTDHEQRNYALRVAEHCFSLKWSNRNLAYSDQREMVKGALAERMEVVPDGLAEQAFERLMGRKVWAWIWGIALTVWVSLYLVSGFAPGVVWAREIKTDLSGYLMLLMVLNIFFYFRSYRSLEEQKGGSYWTVWTFFFAPIGIMLATSYTDLRGVINEYDWYQGSGVVLAEPFIGLALAYLFILVYPDRQWNAKGRVIGWHHIGLILSIWYAMERFTGALDSWLEDPASASFAVFPAIALGCVLYYLMVRGLRMRA